MRAQPIRRCQIDRMITLSDIERAAVDLNAFDHLWNKDIWVGISIAVRICRQIVRNHVSAHGDELRDRFAVIAGDSRREVLRSLDSAGGGLDRVSGYRNWNSGTPGIRVKQVLADKDSLTRVGCKNVHFIQVRCHHHGLELSRHLNKLELLRVALFIRERNEPCCRCKAGEFRRQVVFAGMEVRKRELALAIRARLILGGISQAHEPNRRARDNTAASIQKTA